MFGCFSWPFVALVVLQSQAVAGGYQIRVEYLECKNPTNSFVLVFQEVPKEPKVQASLTVSAEADKRIFATAQLPNKIMRLSALVQKLEHDQILMEIEPGFTLEVPDRGSSLWTIGTKFKLKLGEKYGVWCRSDEGIRCCNTVIVTQGPPHLDVELEPMDRHISSLENWIMSQQQMVGTFGINPDWLKPSKPEDFNFNSLAPRWETSEYILKMPEGVLYDGIPFLP